NVILGVRGIFVFQDGHLTMDKCELVEPKPVSLKLSAVEFNQINSRIPFAIFRARYMGKTLELTGKVEKNRPLGHATVHLEAPDGLFSSVYCFFFDKERGGVVIDEEELRKISGGQI